MRISQTQASSNWHPLFKSWRDFRWFALILSKYHFITWLALWWELAGKSDMRAVDSGEKTQKVSIKSKDFKKTESSPLESLAQLLAKQSIDIKKLGGWSTQRIIFCENNTRKDRMEEIISYRQEKTIIYLRERFFTFYIYQKRMH